MGIRYARYCKRKGCSEMNKLGVCESWQRCDYFQPENLLYVPIEGEKVVTSTLNGSKLDVPYEADEQTQLNEWCEKQGILFTHIPNEAKRSKRVGAELVKQGMKKGFPDNFIPIARNGYHGLFIELKRRDKSKSRVSDEQRDWIEKLNAEGYCAEICYGADAAITVIENYIHGGNGDKASTN